MKPLRIYVDSSVLGGCGDAEFEADSLRLMEWARHQDLKLLISEITLRELEPAPPSVKDILNSLPAECLEYIVLTSEMTSLRDAYLEAGVVGPRWMDDAAHVAAATVARADAIVSWNFKHIVRLEKIKGYNDVNLSHGYEALTIITPREVRLHESEG
ncbi:MAG: hypothetical protein ABSB82_04500 [Terriglobia bacterium]